jgi:protein ImuA
MARADLIRDLKEKLRRWEGAERSPAAMTIWSTGLPELDRLLPQGGLTPGTLWEWLSAGEGAGSATLTLLLAARLQAQGGALVVIDEAREFYPPAAAQRGIALERTVVVQPANARDALWAWEQALRSPAGCTVWGWLERLDDRSFRRLQLAVEAGGGLGLLLRPQTCRPSWAEARLLVTPVGVARPESSKGVGNSTPFEDSGRATLGRRLRVELLHCRGGFGGGAALVEFDHEADPVPVAVPVADPAPARRAARA